MWQSDFSGQEESSANASESFRKKKKKEISETERPERGGQRLQDFSQMQFDSIKSF